MLAQNVLQKYNRILFRAQHRLLSMRRGFGLENKFLIGALKIFRGSICVCWKLRTQGRPIGTVNLKISSSRVQSRKEKMQCMLCHLNIVHVSSLCKIVAADLPRNVRDTLSFVVQYVFFLCDGLSELIFKLNRHFAYGKSADLSRKLDVRADIKNMTASFIASCETLIK